MHECPAPGCTVLCPFERFACRAHWYSIPKKLRDELWRAWRSGTLDEYQAAREKCVAFLEQEASFAT